MKIINDIIFDRKRELKKLFKQGRIIQQLNETNFEYEDVTNPDFNKSYLLKVKYDEYDKYWNFIIDNEKLSNEREYCLFWTQNENRCEIKYYDFYSIPKMINCGIERYCFRGNLNDCMKYIQECMEFKFQNDLCYSFKPFNYELDIVSKLKDYKDFSSDCNFNRIKDEINEIINNDDRQWQKFKRSEENRIKEMRKEEKDKQNLIVDMFF